MVMEDAASALQQLEVEREIASHLKVVLTPAPVGDAAGVERRAVALVQLAVCVNALEETSIRLPELEAALQPIVGLLDDPDLQRNAGATLAAVASASIELWAACLRDTTMAEAALRQLGATEDEGMRINMCSLVSALARGGDVGALAVCAVPGGTAAVVGACSSSTSPVGQEAAADALCAVASCSDCRPLLSEAGAVVALAPLLGVVDAEVRVRALMALGMLLSTSADNQALLAGAPGAVAHLLALAQHSPDADCQAVAGDLVALLVRNEDTRHLVAAALPSPAAT